ncbi:Uncharacterized protein TCM_029968 isoform 2 [Theobroma cacao]|uniref:Uncharacterized protein isoform 2 n=1 Tax=Theobroma cacao TaxID=3641 RepID=A0A061GFN1_THECC|nr:Uncharacterized protein TCM_029968 isoform 2 [Theobroma cacao]
MERQRNEFIRRQRNVVRRPLLTELPRPSPPNSNRKPTGHTQTAVDLKCNTCHYIIPRGTNMPFRCYWRSYIPGCPDPRFKRHMNCSNCSADIVIDLVDGKYVAVMGATQVPDPEDDSEAICVTRGRLSNFYKISRVILKQFESLRDTSVSFTNQDLCRMILKLFESLGDTSCSSTNPDRWRMILKQIESLGDTSVSSTSHDLCRMILKQFESLGDTSVSSTNQDLCRLILKQFESLGDTSVSSTNQDLCRMILKQFESLGDTSVSSANQESAPP